VLVEAARVTRAGVATADAPSVRPRGPWRQAAARFRRRPLGVAALALFLVLIVIGALAPVIAPYGFRTLDFQSLSLPPTWTGHHLFGTDQLGRDNFSRTLYALRTSLEVSFVVTALATALGIVVGALAGFYGGWTDNGLMRLVDFVVTVPAMAVLFVAIVLLGALTPKKVSEVLILYLWVVVARVVRSSAISLRELEYVEAARAAGASSFRVIARHIVPNALGPIIVAATALFGQVILLEAMVEFFSFGVDSNQVPTLGNLIADGTKYNGLDPLWWLYTFPAIMLVVLLVCVNFVGDSLDDALNPVVVTKA
jgi:ABC-type dipeptide/oligopeptide/nickel transport system permease subunit